MVELITGQEKQADDSSRET